MLNYVSGRFFLCEREVSRVYTDKLRNAVFISINARSTKTNALVGV